MNSITFLGTGGGRVVISKQVRASGGIYFDIDGIRFVLDPGPGSLWHMRQQKLRDPQGILLSHIHIDHSSDANAILDGIKEPFIIAEKECLKGSKTEQPSISRYHLSKAVFLKPMKAGDSTTIPNTKIKITATPAKHTSSCVGFLIEDSKKIGYVSDSIYFKGMQKPFEGCDLLIMNILVPSGKVPIDNKHLGIDGAIKMVNSMKKKPKKIIIQHFSFWMLRNDVNKQAKILEKAAGVPVIAARDFMKFSLDEMDAEKKGIEKFTK